MGFTFLFFWIIAYWGLGLSSESIFGIDFNVDGFIIFVIFWWYFYFCISYLLLVELRGVLSPIFVKLLVGLSWTPFTIGCSSSSSEISMIAWIFLFFWIALAFKEICSFLLWFVFSSFSEEMGKVGSEELWGFEEI